MIVRATLQWFGRGGTSERLFWFLKERLIQYCRQFQMKRIEHKASSITPCPSVMGRPSFELYCKPGLRAGLTVVETTQETLAGLGP